ncbi:MAG: GNAT family N-acetyltransferase, partial [Pseudomonadota bacterium]
GIGTKLLTAIEAHGRHAGAHVFVAGISGANPAALGFFGARGFVEAGRLAETGYKGGRYLDLVLMQKTLSAS